MTEKLLRYDSPRIEPTILTVRGRKVVLDMELARIYGVTTKVFNQAVKRNRRKFPPDFMFRLTAEEYDDLTSQFAISNRSQIVTGSQKHRNPRYVPYAFNPFLATRDTLARRSLNVGTLARPASAEAAPAYAKPALRRA